jgi:AAA family ATP:ADP antiporter
MAGGREQDKADRSPLERFLGIFAEVRAGEGITVVLLFLNIFLILGSYYIMKTVREALAIGGISVFGIGGAEVKAYLPAVMALLMIGIVPAYGALASKVDRIKLIRITTTIVIACLAGFWLWGRASGVGTAIGLTFFIWLGIVNVFLIAQFWSFANDIYTEAQGKRLFAVIAIGQSLGAVLGPKIAAAAADYTFLLLAGTGVVLGGCLALYTLVNARQHGSDQDGGQAISEPLQKDGGFELVFKTRYLLLIALMILITNLVNTTGEYILSSAAETKAEQEQSVTKVLGADAEARLAANPGESMDKVLTQPEIDKLKNARSPVVGEFYGNFFFGVNLVGVLIQMLLVSRIFKYFGVRAALFALPLIAFGGYAAIALVGGLMVVRIAKTAENATDYSLQNTVKQALFLPTSREAKYKAKAAIDMFFVRFGDAASAGLVAVGLRILGFGAREFAFVVLALCGVWIAINIGIAREHKKLVPDDTAARK